MTSAAPAVEMIGVRLLLGRSGTEPVEFRLQDFSAAAGEQVALTGPSGCGKSTLLNLVSGLVRPDAGAIRVRGTDIARLSPVEADRFRGRETGFVFQTFNLLEPFTALENVMLGMRFSRRPGGVQRARDLLERAGLSHRMASRPSRLSVGERQRVAIARALAPGPALLLADEPTGALDPATASQVFDLLVELCRAEGATLLLVTHDLELAARLPRRFDCRGLVARSGGAAA